MRFLIRLRFVVSGPLLRVRFLDGHSLSESLRLAIINVLPFNRILDCEDVFTWLLTRLKIRACAVRRLRIRINRVPLLSASLRRHKPRIALASEF